MKLRTKLFIPLFLFSLLFGSYIHFFWLPQLAGVTEVRTQKYWQAHLSSVAEGLVPLLLEGQLANVYESLDVLLEQNNNWIAIKLIGKSGKTLYPLDNNFDFSSLPKHVRILRQPVIFLKSRLAELEVAVDFKSVYLEMNKFENDLRKVFLLLFLAFVLVVLVGFEWVVRRRLKELSNATDQLASGDFNVVLPTHNEDEIGHLIHGFNLMRESLINNYKRLQTEVENHKTTAFQLAEQEQKIRHIIDNSSNLFYSYTPDHVLTYLSPQTRFFLDCEPDEAQQQWSEFMQRDSMKRVLDNQHKAIQTGQRQPPYHIELVGKKGHRIIVNANEAPVLFEGDVIAIVGAFTDITEQTKAEGEQRRLQRELQQAHKMEALGRFTGGVAHDFNNIMGIIQGYAELARSCCSEKSSDEVSTYFDRIQSALDRAIALVSQMLSFSRDADVSLSALFFQDVIEEELQMLRSLLPSSIELEFEIQKDLPQILMNQAQMHQVLTNLSTNARDAMGGEGVLSLRLDWARHLDAECVDCHAHVQGDWIALSVTDTGEGIPLSILNDVFNPFFTTKEVGKGTGLGMSVIHGVLHSHHAHILVETKINKGTTFHLLFPPVVDNKIEMKASSEDLYEGNLSGKGEQILVIDDEPELARFMADLLSINGYQVTLSTSSLHALEIFTDKPNQFDLLITDQTMPEMSGVELVTKVRGLRPEIPIILCTGYSESINEVGAAEMDINYLLKPVKTYDLLQTVSVLLKQSDR